jgi:hypothetical protein
LKFDSPVSGRAAKLADLAAEIVKNEAKINIIQETMSSSNEEVPLQLQKDLLFLQTEVQQLRSEKCIIMQCPPSGPPKYFS